MILNIDIYSYFDPPIPYITLEMLYDSKKKTMKKDYYIISCKRPSCNVIYKKTVVRM